MKKLLLIFSCIFFSVGLVYSQKSITATGTVIDDTGIEVVGASVVLKGTTTGVATDIDGKFSLNVPEGGTLVFSLIGMQTLEMKAATNMKVVMRNDEELLDEVVVVAYGTAKKSQFTGSAAKVGAESIKEIQSGSFTKGLEGRLSGVNVTSKSGNPGEDATILIRGTGSILAQSNPLYVVDGVPYEGKLNAINPRDVESMTVLKDAAANSLYGARGSNGVILITTKGGKRGSKPKVSVDAKWGVSSLGTPLYDMISDSGEYYETFWRAIRNQQLYKIGATPSEASLVASQTLVTKLGGYNSFDVPNGMLIDPNTGKLNPSAKLLYQDDWKDEILKTGFRQEYQASVTGGTDQTSYLISLSHLKDEGLIENSAFERFTGRLKLDQDITKWFRVGANMSYARTKTNFYDDNNTNGSNPFYLLNTMAPIYPIYEYNAQGERIKDKDGNYIYDFGSGDVNKNHMRPISASANPIGTQVEDLDISRINFFQGSLYAEARFLNDFKFRVNVSYDNQDDQQLYYQNGLYGQFKNYHGITTKINERTSGLTGNQLLTWGRKFDDHNLDVLLGHESYQYRYNYVSASKRQFFDLGNVEMDGAVADPLASSYENNYRVESYLSRFQYDYKSKYFFSASFRTDGSSVFHKDERWGQFWSVGGSWLLTSENFMKPYRWINELKVKASYGTQGNDRLYKLTDKRAVSPWATQYVVKPAGEAIALEEYHVGNKKLTWEKSKAFNTGIEFSVLNNRLSGSIEYYNKSMTDMLFNRRVPNSSGFNSYPDNIGNMTDQGVDIELSATAYKSKDWIWDVYLNASHISNKITKLPSENVLEGVDAGLFWYREGRSRYDYYLADYVGVNEQGQSLWYKDEIKKDLEGNEYIEKILTTDFDEATRYYQGSALPTFYGGLGTTVRWRDIDFSLHTAYSFGGTGYDYTYKSLMHSGVDGNAWHKDILNSWSEDNQNTNIPRLQAGETTVNNTMSNRWLISSDYFSIQNLTIGYTFPRELLSKLHVSSLRVYGTGENLALFSKRKGYDPRYAITGVNGYGSYSSSRTISFGLNLEF